MQDTLLAVIFLEGKGPSYQFSEDRVAMLVRIPLITSGIVTVQFCSRNKHR